MSNDTRITVLRRDVTDRLLGKVAKMGNIDGFLKRVIYQDYRAFQAKRWDTEGASEGMSWERLNPTYRRRKEIRFANYEYGGKKMGVATGRLLKSAVGPSEDHRVTVGGGRLTVVSTVPYAAYFDDKRSISRWSEASIKAMKDRIREYLKG